MKPFAACAFVALLSGVLSSPAGPATLARWESFKALHGKSHPAHEEPARLAAFMAKEAEIEAHNTRFTAGLESYSRRVNQYSDLSHAEFRKFALGFVAAVNASDIPMSQEPSMPSLPAKFDWRDQGIMTPITDQGMCGSCYAFAGAAAFEAYLKWKHQKSYDLSEQDVVDCSYHKFMRGAHNDGCDGGWPTAVYEYYNVKDVITEAEYPYTSGRTQSHGRCQIANARRNDVKGRLTVKNIRTRDENQMAQILMEKGPLVIAMGADNEYQRFFDDLHDGVFDRDDAINIQPNHAVVIVGFGTQNGKPYWVIKNSWGKQWAMQGYGKIVRGKNMCNLTMFGVWYVEE